MRLAELARHPLCIQSWLGNPEHELTTLSCDSRTVRPCGTFYALRGAQRDGHAFVPQALAAGAAVLLLSDPQCYARLRDHPPAGVAGLLLLPPERAPLADVTALISGAPAEDLRLLAVTGTSGKTTVSHLVSQLYGARGRSCGVIGSLGMFVGGVQEEPPCESGHTTPEAPVIAAFLQAQLARGIEQVVLEATSIGIALERTRGLRFEAAAFTNLSRDHLDFHGSLARYEAAKARLFLENPLDHAVLNADDKAALRLAKRLARQRPELPQLTFGVSPEAALQASALRTDAHGSRGLLCWRGQRVSFVFPLPGGFNLSNALAAVALLLATGEPLEPLAAALADCRGAPGRFEQVPCAKGITAVVDYSHKPEALKNALHAAAALARRRVLVVFGCGGERDRGKRPQMGAIAHRGAAEVILTSDNPRGEAPQAIIEDIAAGAPRARNLVRIPQRREAICYALEQAREGDVVLIAGKGHETSQDIRGAKLPFDDKEVVREWNERQSLAP